jgi:hypothetical protein
MVHLGWGRTEGAKSMNRLITNRIAVSLGAAAFSTLALIAVKAYAAALCGNCAITDIYHHSNDWVWIGTGVNMSSSCASGSNDNYMAVDVSTNRGRSLLALAQTYPLAEAPDRTKSDDPAAAFSGFRGVAGSGRRPVQREPHAEGNRAD